MRPASSRQRGFMLLLTLVLLTIVAVGSAQIARRSLQQATVAVRAEEDLQRRWLVRTAEDVLLPRADAAIEASNEKEPAGGDGLTEAVRRVDVGGYEVELRFTDEQAKINANVLLERMGRRAAQQRLATLIRQAGIDGRVELRPLSKLDRELQGARADWPALASFDQILAASGSTARAELPGAGAELPGAGAGAGVTLWGDGRVNVRRASRGVLEAALAPELGPYEIDRLLTLRREEPDERLAQWLSRLELSRRQRDELEDRLTETSRYFGLGITIHGEHRAWRRFVVGRRVDLDAGLEDQPPQARLDAEQSVRWRDFRGRGRGWRVVDRRIW